VPLELPPLAAAPLPPAPLAAFAPLADPVPTPAPLEGPVVVPLVLPTEPDAGPVVPLLVVPVPVPTTLPLPLPPLAPVAATLPLLALLPLDAELPLPWPTTLVGVELLHAAPTRSAAHGPAWSHSVRFILNRLAAQPRNREDKVDYGPRDGSRDVVDIAGGRSARYIGAIAGGSVGCVFPLKADCRRTERDHRWVASKPSSRTGGRCPRSPLASGRSRLCFAKRSALCTRCLRRIRWWEPCCHGRSPSMLLT
jgi:hypothetical protein